MGQHSQWLPEQRREPSRFILTDAEKNSLVQSTREGMVPTPLPGKMFISGES